MRVEIARGGPGADRAAARAAEQPDQVLLDHVERRAHDLWRAGGVVRPGGRGAGKAGIERGTPVGIFVADTFECTRAWLAITTAGMVAVPMNTTLLGARPGRRSTPRRGEGRAGRGRAARPLRGHRHRADARAAGRGRQQAAATTGGVPTSSIVALAGQGTPGSVPAAVPELHDTAMFLFTSGTTGPAGRWSSPGRRHTSHWSQVPADTLGRGEALYAPVAMFHNSGIGALQYVV